MRVCVHLPFDHHRPTRNFFLFTIKTIPIMLCARATRGRERKKYTTRKKDSSTFVPYHPKTIFKITKTHTLNILLVELMCMDMMTVNGRPLTSWLSEMAINILYKHTADNKQSDALVVLTSIAHIHMCDGA